MQTPEKLSLIGGSILLASTLVFTLKSQASNILPKVDQGMTSLFKSDKDRQADQQKQQQAQEKQAFDKDYQQAQQNHWQTGTWGTAKFYVDDHSNMHVGSGRLSTPYSSIVDYTKIETINFDGAVQAPQDSTYLLAPSGNEDNSKSVLKQINNLSRLDTSQVTDMNGIFSGDEKLQGLDVSHFNTSNVTNMYEMFTDDSALSNLSVSNFDTHNATEMGGMFEDDDALSNLDVSHFNTLNTNDMGGMFWNDHDLSKLDVSHFDTHNVTSMNSMFDSDNALSSLDVSHFNTSHVNDMAYMFDDDSSLSNLNVSHFDTSDDTSISHMFGGDNSLAKLDLSGWNTSKVISGSDYTGDMFNGTLLNQLTLGNNTKLSASQGWYGNYKNGSQILNTNQLIDENPHPGTWVKQ